MIKNPAIWIVSLVSFVFGLLYFKNVAAAALTAIFGVFLWKIYTSEIKGERRHKNQRDGTLTLLLAAAVIKADGRIYQKERDLVRKKFENDFGKITAAAYMQKLEACLRKKVQINAVCHHVNQQFTESEKIQILHFLVGIAVSNGILVRAERELLQKIAVLIEIPTNTFKAVLAMFTFQSQHSHNEKKSHKKEQKQDENTRSNVPKTGPLERSYQILELSSKASDEEIKKAYRRLAKIHHPDRVIHLGESFQKTAKEKFQKLQEAYDLVKLTRGFK